MVCILDLQRAHQDFKFGEAAQILKARVFHERRPAREAGAHAAIQPFKGWGWLLQHGEDTRDLMVGMVRVAKRFWARTRLVLALDGTTMTSVSSPGDGPTPF